MDAETRDKIAIYWNYGSDDFLAPGSSDSEARFAALGFTVDSLIHQGAGHCAQEINIDGNTVDFWMRHTE